MIRHGILLTQVEAAVDASETTRTWRKRAAKATAKHIEGGKVTSNAPDWSEVKPMLLRLQGSNKCVYCERVFGSLEVSLVEFDLEHFRPKGTVQPWAVPEALKDAGVKVAEVAKDNIGYFSLIHDLRNYSVSCKTCNTIYKLDRFPVRKAHAYGQTDEAALLAEDAYLINPFCDWDLDPEAVIGFEGYFPVAMQAQGPKALRDRERALVTIAFFGLDDPLKRSDLFLDRAKDIFDLYGYLTRASSADVPDDESARARRMADFMQTKEHRHAGCNRAFARLFVADHALATTYKDAAFNYLMTKSPIPKEAPAVASAVPKAVAKRGRKKEAS